MSLNMPTAACAEPTYPTYPYPRLETKYRVTESCLGEGGFGKVFVGTCRISGAPVAIKYFKSQDEDDEDREVETMIELTQTHPHKHILKMFDVMTSATKDTNEATVLVMELGTETLAACRKRLCGQARLQ